MYGITTVPCYFQLKKFCDGKGGKVSPDGKCVIEKGGGGGNKGNKGKGGGGGNDDDNGGANNDDVSSPDFVSKK